MRNTRNRRLNQEQMTIFHGKIRESISLLNHYVALHVKNSADVEGRVQDTLLAAYGAYQNFEGKSSFQTWLIGIAKHQIAQYYRKTSNGNNAYSYDDTNGFAKVQDDCYQSVKCEETLSAISKLPQRYQQILYWHAVDGLKHKEIGKKLGISENAVNLRLHRARTCLCKKLKKFQKAQR